MHACIDRKIGAGFQFETQEEFFDMALITITHSLGCAGEEIAKLVARCVDLIGNR